MFPILPSHYDYWVLYHKVTFDGANSLIFINEDETNIDIGVDLYSAWKQWMRIRDNSKFLPAMRAVGGDPTVGGDFLGSTYFTINNWRITTPVNQNVTFVGNIYSDDFPSPFTVADGSSLVTNQVSNLIDKIAADLSEVDLTNESIAAEVRVELTAELDDVVLIKKILRNRLEMSEDATANFILYDDDNVTPLLTWDVNDKSTGAVQLPDGVPALRQLSS